LPVEHEAVRPAEGKIFVERVRLLAVEFADDAFVLVSVLQPSRSDT
jgi:hypothetical protein